MAITAGLLWLRTAASEQIDHVSSIISAEARPPAPPDASLQRVLPAPLAPGGSGGHTFMVENERGPAGYDPCRPLHLVVNPAAAPADADAILREAMSTVSAASGVHMVLDGSTDELAAESRPAIDRNRYGNRWAPVLVAWTTPAQDPRLDGLPVGIGGSQAVRDSAGRLRNVTGIVHLDGPAFDDMLSQEGGRSDAVAIVAHELIHLLGLGHVDDPGQLMAERYEGQTTLGDGDRRGLARLADVPCTREL